MGKLTKRRGKLVFKEGNQESVKDFFRKHDVTPEMVKEWFRSEMSNPCCEKPQFELCVLDDLRIAFHCLNCDVWRFRERLNALSKKKTPEQPVTNEESHKRPKYDEVVHKKYVNLNRKCIICKSDNWRFLKLNSFVSAIQCLNCNHVELHIFKKRSREMKIYITRQNIMNSFFELAISTAVCSNVSTLSGDFKQIKATKNSPESLNPEDLKIAKEFSFMK